MRILLLVTAFNGLSQRIHEQLKLQGHSLSVVFAGQENEVRFAIDTFEPELILCPFLKQRIPDDIWQKHLCIIIHPGIIGDRGPSSLDWAILNQETQWGVTALQADSEMDAGDIWSSKNFKMRPASKASLYRQEVSQMSAAIVNDILEWYQMQDFKPLPLDYSDKKVKGQLRPLIRQNERSINWHRDSTLEILRKIHAADSFPGVLDDFFGMGVYLFGAHPEPVLKADGPKKVIAQRDGAICVSTLDGAIWISHMKQQKEAGKSYFKLPAAQVLAEHLEGLPELKLPPLVAHKIKTYKEISYREADRVGYLYFNFHNGAMGTEQCQRLLTAYKAALCRNTRILVLMGGDDFFSNGIHLNHIEASEDPAAESWRNINAIDDLVQAILETRNKITLASLGNNAGAGGVMLALACDQVVARDGVVLNPHYKTMGLYGSEYWTYTLPRRIGYRQAIDLSQSCMPLGAQAAADIGLLDAVFPSDPTAYQFDLKEYCRIMLEDDQYVALLSTKLAQRDKDELEKPLARYREEELEQMKQCFWGENSRYHQLRKNFVYKVCPTKTPQRLTQYPVISTEADNSGIAGLAPVAE
ncbi:hydrogenase maturation protein [Thalassomonas viridans]|uniref:Hydrogenase maturation protein n=1 Tax=Thalassomonas viridans TaxID=137584 RepID=A0AAF0C7H9_9GAMM|nr:hydrogenase maturation protein [Thalassomonas viridans]WDE03718.1 hydrogenase maturation protein [Thalassomonas viridans]